MSGMIPLSAFIKGPRSSAEPTRVIRGKSAVPISSVNSPNCSVSCAQGPAALAAAFA